MCFVLRRSILNSAVTETQVSILPEARMTINAWNAFFVKNPGLLNSKIDLNPFRGRGEDANGVACPTVTDTKSTPTKAISPSEGETPISVRLQNPKFSPECNQTIDLQKVNLEVIKICMAGKMSEILAREDDVDVAMEFCFNLLYNERFLVVRLLEIELTGFLEVDTTPFCKELFRLCLSAQSNPQGIPKELLEAKERQLRHEEIETGNTAAEAPLDPNLEEYESSDSGSDWFSDYSGIDFLEEDHPFGFIKPILVRKGLLAFQNAKLKAQAVSNDTAAKVTPSSTCKTKASTTSRKKRSREMGGNSEDARDSDDNDEYPAKRPRTSKGVSGDQASFACPFAKKDPLKYRCCYAYVLKRVRDVKQHLSRFHQLPMYCPRCMCIFDAEGVRDEHIRESYCLVKDSISFEGVTRAQKIQLGQRVSSKMSQSDQWFTIFDILFPGHTPRPKSAYINAELSVELEVFQDLMYAEGPKMITSAIQSSGWHISAMEEDDSTSLLQSAIQDGLQQVFQQWSASMPDIPQDLMTSRVTSADGSSSSPASHTIQGSEPSRLSSNIILEDAQETSPAAQREPQLERYEAKKDHISTQGIFSNWHGTVEDTLTLLPSNTAQQNSKQMFDADIRPERAFWKGIPGLYPAEEAGHLGALESDSWDAFDPDVPGIEDSWSFDAAFDEARVM
jgi:hypothetical protein